MIKGAHYKPPELVDELLGRYRYDPKSGLFKDIDTLLIGNNLLIAKKDAKTFIEMLFRYGYIISDMYLYTVSGDESEYLYGLEPNFDTDTEYYYPTKEMIFDLLDSEHAETINYVEIIAGTVEVEYRGKAAR